MDENSEVSQESTVVEPVVTTEETTSPTEETATSEAEKTESEAKPEKTFTQSELDDILQRRLAKEQRKIERYARAEAERDQLREQLNRQTQAQQASIPSGEPKPEQFKTYEDYIDKLTDYKVEKQLARLQEQTTQRSQVESQHEYESRLAENLSKAAEKYDDFQEVVESIPANYVSIPMRDAIGESEVGGEIAYYLGTHHKEAAEIAKMTPVQQVKAIDRLETKLKAPPKVSEAPAPAQVVGKGKSTQPIDLDKASLDDYMKARQKQGARWANR